MSIPPLPLSPTPDHTWKAVARAVLSLIQRTGDPSFTIDQVYDFTPHLQAQFPSNRHVREKTRQSLQKLVADGILLRTARGVYQLNAASPELQITTAPAVTSSTHGSADTRRVDVPSTTFPTRTTELNYAPSPSADSPGSARALTRTLPSATHTPLPTGKTGVPRVQRITSVRLRNTLLAIEIKRRYNYQCQVCRKPSPCARPSSTPKDWHQLEGKFVR